ncbi:MULTISPECIES: GTP-binding protein [unclassified Nocardiopsis]|uniref:GTP-binding protein n=1 Tax=Nocardiopsis TaxID=2013 RepID=UPI00387A9CBA
MNIGIVAHVDAGKTSLTERLLFHSGAIDRLGSVDGGDTRTDTGAIERARGITVRTAVAPLRVGDARINLIDTPGHTDFVAEVERALAVLDGAVLVLSAVEGVQAHTRVLMRTLSRAGVPTLLFVNKVDRVGARPGGVLADVRRLLTPDTLALDRVVDPGTPGARVEPLPALERSRAVAEALAAHDEDLLGRLVEERPLPPAKELEARLADRVGRAQVHPVLFGSAITGAGTAELVAALTGLLPAARDTGGPEPHGTVFSVEATGERVGHLRLFGGTLAARRRLTLHRRDPDGTTRARPVRLTRLEVVGDPGAGVLTAGHIARVHGVGDLRVGDRLGPPSLREPRFARPSLEALVRPEHDRDRARLHAALRALADRDPLIAVRTVPGRGVSVLLYGEVQKEVIAQTLAEGFGVRAVFERSRIVHVERPAGTGSALETVESQPPDGWPATVGLRVEAGPPGSGTVFGREVELGALFPAFDRAVVETVHRALEQGLYGWRVIDCAVTMTHSGFTPSTVPGDFRRLVPMVLLRALEQAGTRVLEPEHAFEVQVPADALGPVTGLLAGLEGRVHDTRPGRGTWTLAGDVPARTVGRVQAALAGLPRGEGFWESRPAGLRPVAGEPPRRERTDGNPLVREEYLIHLGREGGGRTAP